MKQTFTNRHSRLSTLRGTTRILLCMMALFLIGGGTNAWGQETYTYTFTQKTWSELGNQTLNNVVWTASGTATSGDYFGYDNTKGQQFGSGSKPFSSLNLATSSIEGTISSVRIQTSGASSISASVGISVGNTPFLYNNAATYALTQNNTSVEFLGNATGEVVISYTNTSSKALYIKSIEITYTSDGGTPTVATPTFSPAEGTYEGPQSVSISCATTGATIRYTTDGQDPDESSGTMYSGEPIQITESTTLKAQAWFEDYTPSAIASATYTITLPKAAAPTLPASFTFTEDYYEVNITNNEKGPGSRVYYTTDGTNPTTSSSYFEGPSGPSDGSLRLTETTTVKAMAVAEGKDPSDVVTATYTKLPAGMEIGTINYVFSEHYSATGPLGSNSINELLSFSTDKGSSNNVPAYNNGGDARFYYGNGGNGGSMTITPAAGVTITGITLTAVNSYTPTVKYNVNGGSDIEMSRDENNVYSATSLSANTSFRFRNANTSNKQLRITSISIIYIYTPSPSITVSTDALEGFSYRVGNGPSVAQTFTVTGSHLTDHITLATTSPNFEFSADGGASYGNTATIQPMENHSVERVVYVRLKAGLEIGSYNGAFDFIGLSSEGAHSKSVSLSGEVLKNSYTVTFDVNGNTTLFPPLDVVIGQSIAQALTAAGRDFPMPHTDDLSGFGFVGWSTSEIPGYYENVSQPDGLTGSFAPDADLTLYAVCLVTKWGYDNQSYGWQPDDETWLFDFENLWPWNMNQGANQYGGNWNNEQVFAEANITARDNILPRRVSFKFCKIEEGTNSNANDHIYIQKQVAGGDWLNYEIINLSNMTTFEWQTFETEDLAYEYRYLPFRIQISAPSGASYAIDDLEVDFIPKNEGSHTYCYTTQPTVLWFSINDRGNYRFKVPRGELFAPSTISCQPEDVPSEYDFSFAGWSLTEDNPEIIAPTESILPYDGQTLYAVFSRLEGGFQSATLYEKVTSEPTDWTGKYLLVYESGNTSVAWTGIDKANCNTNVSIADGIISTKPDDAVLLDINPMEGGYSIRVEGGENDGKYINKTANSNGLDFNDIAQLNTLAFDTNKVVITASGGCVMKYNDASGQKRFRYYQDYGKPVQLYKQIAGNAPATLHYYTRVFDKEIAEQTTRIKGPSIIPSGSYLNMAGGYLISEDASKLIIDDGAELTLLPNDSYVEATVKKRITGYGESQTGHYYLIAPPVYVRFNEPGAPLVPGMFTPNYDLYGFKQDSELEWINYKEQQFCSTIGSGVLYASATDTELSFAGEICDGNTTGITLRYAEGHPFSGFNLIGNPFTSKAYMEGPVYVMNEDGDEVVPAYSPTLEPCQGFLVVASVDKEYRLFHSGTAPANSQGNLSVSVSENGSRGMAQIDRAIVSFRATNALPKFSLNANSSKLYIPQGDKHFAAVNAESQGTLPLCFEANKNGEYSLSFSTEGIEAEYLHLIDNLTGADTDLLATSTYSFSAKTTDYASRFKLVFKAQLNDDEQNANAEHSFAYLADGDIIVSNEGRATLQVIDMLGHVLSSQTINGDCRISTNTLTAGLYILNLNGMTQKIVVR